MNIFNSIFGQQYQQFPQNSFSHRQTHYSDQLKAYPAYLMDRNDLEKGDKILMPTSALHILSNQHVPNPMIFCLQNTFLNKQTFVGVLEFVAEEGTCVLPNWVFQNLNLEIDQKINVTLNTQIKKGTFVRIQPHETTFIELPDPRAILEMQLRYFTTLTVDNTIPIEVAGKVFQIDILEVRPENQYRSICLVEANVEVDFAPPLDYEENLQNMTKKTSSVVIEEEKQKQLSKPSNSLFSGAGVRIDQQKINYAKLNQLSSQRSENNILDINEWDPRKHRITRGIRGQQLLFQGNGVKLSKTSSHTQKRVI